MRSCVIYGSIILCCLVISTANADKKWQYDEEKKADSKTKYRGGNGDEKHKNGRNSKKYSSTDLEIASAEDVKPMEKKHQKTKNQFKKPRGNDDDNSSEELTSSKHTKQNGDELKRFIGRIEHGKVMVLRRKGENEEKVCRKSKGGKHGNCNGNGNDPDTSDEDRDDSNEEDEIAKGKHKKKIKYSIKFQHEKQKQTKNDGDMRIMKLHRNGKKRYGKDDDDDDDSDEEDESPIKRFHFIDDDD